MLETGRDSSPSGVDDHRVLRSLSDGHFMNKRNDRDCLTRKQLARLYRKPLTPVQNRLTQLSPADQNPTPKRPKHAFPS